MSAAVRCDYCGRGSELQRTAVGTFALPLGWRTPHDDDQRTVYREFKCREVCASCENDMYKEFALRKSVRFRADASGEVG